MKLDHSSPILPDGMHRDYTARARGETHVKPSHAELAKLNRLKGKRHSRRIVAATAMLTDIAVVVIAFALASFVRLGAIDTPQLANIFLAVLPIFLFAALNNSAHQVSVLLDGFRSAWRATSAFLLAAAAMLLIAFFMQIGESFSRLLFGMGSVFALVLITGSRIALARFAQGYLGKAPFANLCIYDGVERTKHSGEGSIVAREHGLNIDTNSRAVIARLGEITQGMDRVIVHCQPKDREAWCFLLKSVDVPSEIVIPEFTDLAPISIHRRSGQTSIQLATGPLAWNQQLAKRIFDVAVVVVALPVLAPILAVVAVLIKLDSKGPVFFRQQRLGLGNRPFTIFKFRSMRSEMCDAHGNVSTMRDDDRITRIGAFIRKTSIDELPQIFNVLKGDMSVVGPRPHAMGSTAENRLFWDIDTRYWHRHCIRPGLTGLAQVRGFRGATEVESDLSNRLISDLEYAAHWSLLLDIKIIIMTFGVLFHRNAY